MFKAFIYWTGRVCAAERNCALTTIEVFLICDNKNHK